MTVFLDPLPFSRLTLSPPLRLIFFRKLENLAECQRVLDEGNLTSLRSSSFRRDISLCASDTQHSGVPEFRRRGARNNPYRDRPTVELSFLESPKFRCCIRKP